MSRFLCEKGLTGKTQRGKKLASPLVAVPLLQRSSAVADVFAVELLELLLDVAGILAVVRDATDSDAAAAQGLLIRLSVLLGHARADHAADQPAGDGTRAAAGEGRRDRAGDDQARPAGDRDREYRADSQHRRHCR